MVSWNVINIGSGLKKTLMLNLWQSYKSQNALHPSHIPQYSIQNRNVHIFLLNGVLLDMGEVCIFISQQISTLIISIL